jgi:ribose transport system substrate-binding protein
MGTSVFLNNVNPPTKNPCITGYVFNENDSTLTAQQAAYKIIADSGGMGHVVYLNAPDVGPGDAFALKVFLNTMAQQCPGCKVGVLNVSVTDVGTALPGKLVSYLQAHPDVKYVRAYYGDQFIGVPAALSSAGLQGINLYSGGGSKVNWAYIKAGQATADWALYLNAYGYQLADLLARAMTKQKFTIPLLPYMWVTKSTDNFNFAAGEPPFGIDYVAAFDKLWAQAK